MPDHGGETTRKSHHQWTRHDNDNGFGFIRCPIKILYCRRERCSIHGISAHRVSDPLLSVAFHALLFIWRYAAVGARCSSEYFSHCSILNATQFGWRVLSLDGQQIAANRHMHSAMFFVEQLGGRGDIQVSRATRVEQFHVVIGVDELESMMVACCFAERQHHLISFHHFRFRAFRNRIDRDQTHITLP
jgi:hypothetical protein